VDSVAPRKFKDKEDIIKFLVKISDKLGIERDALAEKLGISRSAFYGYITRREIPQRSYRRLLELNEGGVATPDGKGVKAAPKHDFSGATLEELIHEIERRGWFVDLKRKVVND